jgi:hypothetical protein
MQLPSNWLRQLTRQRPAPNASLSDYRSALHYPVNPLPRLALIGLDLPIRKPARYFPELDMEALSRFRPEAIAAPLETLQRLASLVSLGQFDPQSLCCPLAIFTSPESSFLAVEERELLWSAFQVPLFEQVRDASGMLLAWECEAHTGLHVPHPALGPSAGVSPLEEPCGCGSAVPRFAAGIADVVLAQAATTA